MEENVLISPCKKKTPIKYKIFHIIEIPRESKDIYFLDTL